MDEMLVKRVLAIGGVLATLALAIAGPWSASGHLRTGTIIGDDTGGGPPSIKPHPLHGTVKLTTLPLASGQLPANWTKSTFHGDSLTVSFDHPKSWESQLGPNGFHYSDTFAYLSNFTLRQFCQGTNGGFSCIWANLGPFPPDGVLMTFGTGGYGPGTETRRQLLGGGTKVLIEGRLAHRSVGTGQGCLGTGGESSLSFAIVDGRPQGAFYVNFCFRAPHLSVLRSEADRVAKTTHIERGPPLIGAQPS